VGFSPDGKTVLAWSEDSFHLHTWHYGPSCFSVHAELGWAQVDAPGKIRWMHVPNFYPSLGTPPLSFSPNGRRVGIQGFTEAFVLNLDTGDLKQVNPPEQERVISEIGWLSDEEVSYATVPRYDRHKPIEGYARVYRQRVDAKAQDRKEVFSVHLPQVVLDYHSRSRYCSPDGRFIILDVAGGLKFVLVDVLAAKGHSFAEGDANSVASIESIAWSPDSSRAAVVIGPNYEGFSFHLLVFRILRR